MSRIEEESLEFEKFDIHKDFDKQDKENIYFGIEALHKTAILRGEHEDWEIFATNSTLAKILFPEEEHPAFDERAYKAINAASNVHFERGNLVKYLQLEVGQKVLFPKQWERYKKDFHSDDIIWNDLEKKLDYISPKYNWDDLYKFYYVAQNMKIIAPERFEELDLQEIMGVNIWPTHIKQELDMNMKLKNYTKFAYLAASAKIINFPGKVELEPKEWKQMKEEEENIRYSGQLTSLLEFSTNRKILAANDIRITNERFDLIF